MAEQPNGAREGGDGSAANNQGNSASAGGADSTNEDEYSADFRAVVSLLASLAASVTYTAGISPPGGVWGADDKANGYIAGLPVPRHTSPRRYKIFYYSNTTAFVLSLVVVAMLSSSNRGNVFKRAFQAIVSLDLLSLGIAYIAGSSADLEASTYYAFVLSALFVIFVMYLRIHTPVDINVQWIIQ